MFTGECLPLLTRKRMELISYVIWEKAQELY